MKCDVALLFFSGQKLSNKLITCALFMYKSQVILKNQSIFKKPFNLEPSLLSVIHEIAAKSLVPKFTNYKYPTNDELQELFQKLPDMCCTGKVQKTATKKYTFY